MEKYIIILVILLIMYYLFTCLNSTKENFADASASNMDDATAIQTLAQLSKQLMAGGITIPGNVNIQGDLVFPNKTNIKGAGRLNIGGEEALYILNKSGVTIGKESGGTGDLVVQGNQSVGGNETVNGNMTVTGVTTCTTLKIGDATLTWDGNKKMLVLDKGLIVNNGLAPGNKTPGLITNNIIFGPSGAPATNDVNNQAGIENLVTSPLKNSWIPDQSSLLGPIRNDTAWTQRWGAIKYPGLGSIATYKDINWYGQWTK